MTNYNNIENFKTTFSLIKVDDTFRLTYVTPNFNTGDLDKLIERADENCLWSDKYFSIARKELYLKLVFLLNLHKLNSSNSGAYVGDAAHDWQSWSVYKEGGYTFDYGEVVNINNIEVSIHRPAVLGPKFLNKTKYIEVRVWHNQLTLNASPDVTREDIELFLNDSDTKAHLLECMYRAMPLKTHKEKGKDVTAEVIKKVIEDAAALRYEINITEGRYLEELQVVFEYYRCTFRKG